LYSRDISEKVKSGQRVRMKQGKFLSSYAFYGYNKSPDDKSKLVIDHEAAGIVKRIFEMRSEGLGRIEIAKILNTENILSPAMYKRSKNIIRPWNTPNQKVMWNDCAIGKILADERYTGKMICGKQIRKSVGSSKIRFLDKDEWIVVPDTHEAIISPELFQKVHTYTTNRRATYDPTNKPLRRLLYCGGCRHVLNRSSHTEIDRFRCKYTRFTGDCNCLQGSLTEDEIAEMLLNAIKTQIDIMADRSNKRTIGHANGFSLDGKVKKAKSNLEKHNNERFDIYKKFRAEKISQDQFQAKRNEITIKIEALEEEIVVLENQAQLRNAEDAVISQYRQYENFEVLNDEIIKTLIDKVYVYDKNHIEIIWKFTDGIKNVTLCEIDA